MSTALAPQGTHQQLAGIPTAGLPAPVDKRALTAYLQLLEDPEALELQQRLAKAYDAACKALIGENDVQKEGGREFKKKSAWRKLGRYFGIATEVVKIEREFLGEEFLATVTVRATAAWGQVAEAVGSCGTDEATGRRTITLSDAIATAETRATNRAVSNLIAMGEVSAEEMSDRGGVGDRQRPEMGLEEASGVVWPWAEPEKYKGKKFGDTDSTGAAIISTLSLLRVQDWAVKKIERGDRSRSIARLQEAASTVLSHRGDLDQAQAEYDAELAKKAAKEKASEAKSEGAAAAAPASGGGPAPDPSSSPAAAPAPEGEQRPDPTMTSAASAPPTNAPSAPAAGQPAPGGEPSVADLQAVADTAAAQTGAADRQQVLELTMKLNALLFSKQVPRTVQDTVRTRLAGIDELTVDVLEAAIAELESNLPPF